MYITKNSALCFQILNFNGLIKSRGQIIFPAVTRQNIEPIVT